MSLLSQAFWLPPFCYQWQKGMKKYSVGVPYDGWRHVHSKFHGNSCICSAVMWDKFPRTSARSLRPDNSTEESLFQEVDSHSAGKDISCLLRNSKIHCRVHKALALVHVHNQMNPFHNLSHRIYLKSILEANKCSENMHSGITNKINLNGWKIFSITKGLY